MIVNEYTKFKFIKLVSEVYYEVILKVPTALPIRNIDDLNFDAVRFSARFRSYYMNGEFLYYAALAPEINTVFVGIR